MQLTVVEIAAVVPRRQRPLAKRKKQLLHSVVTAANSISKSLMNDKFGLDVTYALDGSMLVVKDCVALHQRERTCAGVNLQN